MRTAYITFAALRKDVNQIASGGRVPFADAVLSWKAMVNWPPARYGSLTARSVRSIEAGAGAPTGAPTTVTIVAVSPVPSFRTVSPGATQTLSAGSAGEAVLLGVPVPFRFTAVPRY